MSKPYQETASNNAKRNLGLVLLIFVVGLGLQAILNHSISNYLSKLDHKVFNAEVENIISHEIILEIHKIESAFYTLAAFPNQHLRKIIRKEILEVEEEVSDALDILNFGGNYLAHIDLNLPNTDKQYESFFYQPEQMERFNFAKTDILPKLTIIINKLHDMQIKLEQIEYAQQQDIQQLPALLEELKLHIKLINPIFVRLKEDANQIVYQNRIHFLNIRDEVEERKNFFKVVQLILTFSIFVLVALVIYPMFRAIRVNAEELESSQLYSQELLDSQSTIIIVSDGHNIIDASGGFFELFRDYKNLEEFYVDYRCICDLFIDEPGFLAREVNGKKWIEVLLDEPYKTHKAKIVYNQREYIYQLDITRSQTNQRYIISMFDITEIERIHNELEQERNRAIESTKSKGEFLANMSHEIRTPLNAILGFINLLRDKKHDEETHKYLETIDSSSRALLGIINDILDLSKIESGKLTIEPENFSSHQEMQNIADLFRARCSEKHLNFILKIDPALPQVIYSDLLRLKQIISNLLSNAIKFCPPNKNIIMEVGFKDNRLFISVEDEGIGMTPEAQKKIFEAFTQAETSTTRKYGGTGLGLTISAKLVMMLGGQLQVESEVDKGSRFFFDIPVEVPDLTESQKRQTAKQPLDMSNHYSGKVLLVEDNKTNQLLMKAILKKIGLSFDLAEDGIEAIEHFKKNSYDIILMDENMPNMNGIRATMEIRKIEHNEHLAPTTIVALTANAMIGDRERFLEAGMNDYLTKPINLKELHRVMSENLTIQPENTSN